MRFWWWRQQIALYRFLGFDYVQVGLDGIWVPVHQQTIEDTAQLKHAGGRTYLNEQTGPIASWEDFEKFPWPDPDAPAATEALEWCCENVPEDMCLIGMCRGHFAEWLTWLMGYESLCFALYDKRDLVDAIAAKLIDIFTRSARRVAAFDRVKVLWASDDMGFKTQPLISPADARAYYLPGHKILADIAHKAGMPYILHACGNLGELMDDLIDDVKIDGKHSFEDTIEDVRQVKGTYGRRIAMLGGMDVDFLCRADEQAIRRRVRQTLEVCQAGGGFVLGSGNSVANYVPVENYLAMMDEAWRCAGG
ncbi:MAG: hypothetical protein NTV86_21125 [Planctomycetota bacterium]|nr:hypothetical protein [Planctomycetota bacterium]